MLSLWFQLACYRRDNDLDLIFLYSLQNESIGKNGTHVSKSKKLIGKIFTEKEGFVF